MNRNTMSAVENNQLTTTSQEITIPNDPLRPVAIRPLGSATRDKALFEDSLLDSSIGQRSRRTWATGLSFALQFVFVGFLLLLPLWFTEVLPKEQLVTFLVAPPPPPLPPPAASRPPAVKVVKVTTNIENGRLRAPSRIPAKVQMIKEEEAPPPVATAGVVGGVPGGIPGGQLDGVIGGIIGTTSSLAAAPTLFKPKPVVPAVERVRVSPGVIKGLLIHRVEPSYPFLAQQARIQGDVVLTAIIDKEGNVQHLQLAAAFRSTAEFALETSQQAAACLATLRRVWPDPLIESLSELLSDLRIAPVLSVVLGLRAAREKIPATLALPAFLQSYVANLATAGVRLIPLGQTDGQLAIAELERAVLALAAQAEEATIHDLGSAAFMVDLASASHETQYTRLFRS